MITLDIINYMAAIAVIFLGYKLCIARIKGRKFSELKPLIYSFAICFVIMWFINVYVGFINN